MNTPQPTAPVTPPTTTDQVGEESTSDRRNGKIARLPDATREKLNLMMLDGVPYLQIIERLGKEGEGLIEKNFSTWKTGGYVDWLRARRFTDAIRAKYEIAKQIVSHASPANPPGQALLQIVTANLCEFLVDNDPATIRDSLMSDADKFTRFINAMVRLAEGGIKCEIHKFHTEDRAAQLTKQTKPAEKPGISDEALHTAEQKLKLF